MSDDTYYKSIPEIPDSVGTRMLHRITRFAEELESGLLLPLKPYLRVIGDVHGLKSQYVEIAQEAPHSVQVGDVGFDYSYSTSVLDSERHRIIAGNHDNYAVRDGQFINQTPHFLGDFGNHQVGPVSFFYLRGGYSIDWKYRTKGIDFFEEEELTPERMEQAAVFYEETKPNIVITHDCPAAFCDQIAGVKMWDGDMLRPSRTARFLERLYGIHQPRYWIFGHYHHDWVKFLSGTTLFCLNELSYLDFDKMSHPTGPIVPYDFHLDIRERRRRRE